MELHVKVDRPKPGTVTLTPAGPVNSLTCKVLDREISAVLQENPQTVILDMADVDFVASSGVSAILTAKATLKEAGGVFAVVHLQAQVKKAFEVMHLLPTLDFFGSMAELDAYLAHVQAKVVEKQG